MARNLAVATEFRGFDKMSKPLRNITSKLDKIDRRLRRVQKTSKKTSTSLVSSFGKMAIGVGSFLLAFRGFRLVKDGLFAATKTASDFFEENQKFGVVFRGVSSEADSMRDTLVKSYNFSRLEATQLLAATGDLLVSQGFTRKESLKMSFALNKLAADRASFTNLEGGALRASKILTKALIGEREGLKSIGLAVNSTTQVFKEQFKVGLKIRKGNIDQAKTLATWDIVLKQSADSLGDVARNQGTYASNLRLMESRTSDFTAEIGEAFLPVMNVLLSKFIEGAQVIGQFAKENKKAISSALITGLQFAIKGFGLLVRLGGGLVVAFRAIQLGFSKVVSFGASGISLLLETFGGLGEGVASIFGFIQKTITTVLGGILTAASAVAGVFNDELADSIKKAQKQITSFSGDDFSSAFKQIQKDALSTAKDLDKFNKVSEDVRAGYESDILTVAATTFTAQKAIDKFANNLDAVRDKSVNDIQANKTVIQTETTDPVGNSTPSPAIIGSAQIQGQIDVNFNNKPDNVDVVRPSGNADSGLVLGGSG